MLPHWMDWMSSMPISVISESFIKYSIRALLSDYGKI